jgi:zinc protease
MSCWLLCGLLLVPPSSAAEPGGRRFGLPTLDYVFPTGLRVVVAPDDSAPVVGVTMVLEAGSAYDPPGRAGAAHLAEHLWFRTRLPDGSTVSQRLTALGCEHVAWTNADRVEFTTACPAAVLPQLLEVEAHRLTDPLWGVRDEDLELERRIVVQEGRISGHLDPNHRLSAVLHALHPPTHPYGHLTHGELLDIERTDLGDLRALTAARYRAEHATLVVTGDVAAATVVRSLLTTLDLSSFHPALRPEHLRRYPLEGVEQPDPDRPEHWWVWPNDPAVPDRPLPRATPVDRTVGVWEPIPGSSEPVGPVFADVEEPTVGIAWLLPPFDPYREGFGPELLGIGFSVLAAGSVDLDVRGEVGCSVDPMYRATLLYCQVVSDGEAERAQLARSLARLSSRGSAWRETSEFRGARVAAWRRANLLALEAPATTLLSRSARIAMFAHEGREGNYLQATDDLLKASALEAAYDWLKRHLSPEAARVVNLVPGKEGAAMTGAAAHAAPGVTAAATPSSFQGAVVEGLDAAALAYAKEEVIEKVLASGLRIVAVDSGRMPFVDVALYVPSGAAHGPPGVDELVARSVPSWTGGPAGGLDLGAQYEQQERWTSLVVKGDASKVAEVVAHLRGMVGGLGYGGDRHRDVLRAWKSARSRPSDERAEARRSAAEAVATGMPSWSAPATHLSQDLLDALAEVSAGELRTHLQAKWRPEAAVLVVVGGAEVSHLMEVAVEAFADWRPISAPPLTWADAREWPPGWTVVLADDPAASRAQVSVTCVSRHSVERSLPGAELLGELWEGVAMRDLREETGLTYTPATRVTAGRRTVRLDLRFDVAIEQVGQAVERALGSLREVVGGDFDETELIARRRSLSLAIPLRRQTREQLHASLAPMLLEGWSVDEWRRSPELVAQVSRQTLIDLTATCLDELVVRVDGPASRYEEAVLGATGVDPVRIVLPPPTP